MSNNNNNFNNSIEGMDLLSIYSLIKQLENMKLDNEQTVYIRKVILAISDEISKLHKENDIIIAQNEEILKILKEGDYKWNLMKNKN